MYSFEGEYKRKPQQSFGGASKKLERSDLLHKASAERSRREEKRRQNQAATVIQAFFRGSLVRERIANNLREKFDQFKLQFDVESAASNCNCLSVIASEVVFFYDVKKDLQRLEWLLRVLVKAAPTLTRVILSNPSFWLHKIQKLLVYCLRCLRNAISQSYNISNQLRFIEVYTSIDSYKLSAEKEEENFVNQLLDKIWTVLIRYSYFSVLRIVMDHRVPDSLVTNPEPPTPLAATLLDFMMRPFLVKSPNQHIFLRTLLLEIFTERFTPQIQCFLLPAFALRSNIIPTGTFLTSLLSSEYELPAITSVWILHCVVLVMSQRILLMSVNQIVHYLHVLKYLLQTLPSPQAKMEVNGNLDSDEEDAIQDGDLNAQEEIEVIKGTVETLNDANHVNAILKVFSNKMSFEECMVPLSSLCHFLLDQHRLAIYNYKLLYVLAFKPLFLRQLWSSIITTSTVSVFGSPVPLLQFLNQGMTLSLQDQEKFLPQLTLFCALMNHLLSTLHDFELYENENGAANIMPFTLEELASISLTLRDVCIGLIDLAYPETRKNLNPDYMKAMQSVGVNNDNKTIDQKGIKRWTQLFKYVVILLRHLYSRDSRCRFCPEGQWIAKHFAISFDRAAELHFSNRKNYGYDPFIGLHPFTREELEEDGPPPSAMEIRQIAVLREFPFVIRFHDRVKIFQSLIRKDKAQNQGELVNFRMGPQIQILVRRNFIYEDAFDNLSQENEPNLKLRVLVQLRNAVGLDEVGIDGGGIFREFLNELLKTCFDPNRGFFKTTHDCLLYPNPGIHRLIPDFAKHYYFVGRMLGKAIYENMLIELPFAEFFLAKILAQHTQDVDIHHLASLDPIMYKNLLYLKTYEGDISDLGLDFTVMSSEFGENVVLELKPGGANIPVTENNRITYIHLMADYKLNKQIKAQCQAFKEGLANVIDLEWLYMFDSNELQVLISGAHVPIDIEDLKAHTNYAGGYSYEHVVIQSFWKVVESFDDKRRRQLLKFVTSCSRPPLLGFKELTPAFCIQNAGREDRLPTASTCMNLLKLPEFHDEGTLRTKLIYAVESGAGFELS